MFETSNLNEIQMHVLIKLHTKQSVGGSVADWLVCWTQAEKGPGSNRSRDAVG